MFNDPTMIEMNTHAFILPIIAFAAAGLFVLLSGWMLIKIKGGE
jgi:hypothetical protein